MEAKELQMGMFPALCCIVGMRSDLKVLSFLNPEHKTTGREARMLQPHVSLVD